MRRSGGGYFLHWALLAAIFLYISMDEASVIHERLIPPLRALFDTSGLLYYAWVIPAVAVLIALSLAYFRFLVELPPRIRFLLIASAVIFVSGALGLEMLGGLEAERSGEETLLYLSLSTVEEFLEMAGAAVFIYALMLFSRILQDGQGEMGQEPQVKSGKVRGLAGR